MKTVPLADVAAINPRAERIHPEELVSFVGMAELDSATGEALPREAREYREVSKGYTQFRDGDILVAKITPCFENGKIGVARLDEPIGVGSTEFHVVRPTQHLNTRFALHYLRQSRIIREGELRMTGSGGQRRVPAGYLSELLIPLPPLDEQRRIAAVLDQAAQVIGLEDDRLAGLDALEKSYFSELIRSDRWPEVTLDSVSERPGEYGANLPSITYDVTRPRYVRITDISDQGVLSPLKRSPAGSERDWARFRLEYGDVLFARSGATVGKAYRYTQSDGDCVYAGYLIRFRLDRSAIEPAFLLGFTRTSTYREWVKSRQNVVAQPNINAKQYGQELLVPLPPIGVQREYSGLAEKTLADSARVLERRDLESKLFASLQSRAFRGEV